jgi:hypothetical protein
MEKPTPWPVRPAIDATFCQPIREMQASNIGWGAPRIHGELLKPGIEVSQATVSKYMLQSKKQPSQTWRTFIANHADCLAAMDWPPYLTDSAVNFHGCCYFRAICLFGFQISVTYGG